MHPFRAALSLGVALLLGCASDVATETPVDEGPPIECRGSRAPEQALIDPDDPTYEDADFSNELVRTMFERSRTSNAAAYRSYRAALENADVLSCAFCACGCAGTLKHVSAIDCFKDMHGFT
jgi:hypothetical protein